MINEGSTATAPDGSKVILRGGKWVPLPASPSAPTGFQKYFANPVTSAVARVADPLGITRRAGMEDIPQTVAKAVVPQTPTQAGIDAGMIAGGALLPEVAGAGLLAKLAKPVGRMAMSALGGAGGAAIGGESPTAGAVSGAGQQALGEAPAAAFNAIGTLGKKALNARDVGRVGGFLKSLASWLPATKSVTDFDAAFRGGEATDKVGAKLGKYEGAISKRLGSQPVATLPGYVQGLPMPGVRVPATFDEAVKQIRDLNDKGRYNGNDATLREVAKQARRQAHDLTQELGAGINKVEPGLGDRYLAARRQYAGASLLTRIFSEPKLWDDSGRIDWNELQDIVSNRGQGGYRDELTRVFGRDKTNQFLGKVFRDAPPTARDVKGGLNMGLSVHPGGVPRVFMHPHLSGTVGNVPRRLPMVQPAIPGLAAGQTAGQSVSDFINSLRSQNDAP